jgi:hypothetical protein
MLPTPANSIAVSGEDSMSKFSRLMGTALTLSAFTCSTSAIAVAIAPPPIVITIDENGHGSAVINGAAAVPLTFALLADPGPGGLSSVLTYTLPLGLTLVPGDLALTDADFNNLPGDIIRFNQTFGEVPIPGTISFYSDNVGGADDLADTISPPQSFYTNFFSIAEVGPEGNNGAFYTPTANQPGFITGFAATYHFISDAPGVPEPSTWAMMLAGFGAIGVALRRRRKSLALA